MSKITKVYVRKVNGENGLVGFANVVVDDCLVLNDIAIVNKDDKFYINEPTAHTYTNSEGNKVYAKYYHPITAEFREEFNNSIIAEYIKTL